MSLAVVPLIEKKEDNKAIHTYFNSGSYKS